MTDVRYIGPSARAQVTAQQFKDAGINQAGVLFRKENGWTVNLPPAAAAFVASLPAFTLTSGEMRGLDAGSELGYAQRTVLDTSTNLTATDVALMGQLLPGLQISLVGEGRPVDIEFQSRTRHTVANTLVSSVLMCNGSGGTAMSHWGASASPSTAFAESIYFKRRVLLEAGVVYTFEVAKQIAAAGTATWEGDAFRPTWLMATQR